MSAVGLGVAAAGSEAAGAAAEVLGAAEEAVSDEPQAVVDRARPATAANRTRVRFMVGVLSGQGRELLGWVYFWAVDCRYSFGYFR
jgi:hypothetical protein